MIRGTATCGPSRRCADRSVRPAVLGAEQVQQASRIGVGADPPPPFGQRGTFLSGCSTPV